MCTTSLHQCSVCYYHVYYSSVPVCVLLQCALHLYISVLCFTTLCTTSVCLCVFYYSVRCITVSCVCFTAVCTTSLHVSVCPVYVFLQCDITVTSMCPVYISALLHHQQQRMDKLTDDIEIKRKLLNKLREEVSDAEKSKIVKNSLRTSFPTVSAEVDGVS